MKVSVDKGLLYIKNEQNKDDLFGFKTIFPGVLIFNCLNELVTPLSKTIKAKIKERLLKEKTENWSFNYWSKFSKEYKTEPYPDDLDDTGCALAALCRFEPKIIDGKSLSKIVNLLLLCEDKIGGPYRTWILPKDKSKLWDDVDIAVNSNVGYFLKLQETELDNINKLIEEKINNDLLISPYYKGELPIIYFISRLYRGDKKELLKEKILQLIKKDSSCLDLALAISSLIRLGYKKEIDISWIESIRIKQSNTGSWPSEGFYYYKNKNKKNYVEGKSLATTFIGSKSLTTAFVLEAINLYLNNDRIKNNLNHKISDLKKLIERRVKEIFRDYPQSVKKPILKIIESVNEKDKNGLISGTPLLLYLSLPITKKNKIKDNFLINLGLINLLGWSAYKLYDGIIDGDLKANQLPLVNIILREMEGLIYSLDIDKKTGFFDLYQETMRNTEVTNWLELLNYRFEESQKIINLENFDYQLLAKRSLGHAISSVAVLCKLGYKTDSDEVKNLLSYFENYIIAKQMNDDAHDWYEDLMKGRINSANFEIIKKHTGNVKEIIKMDVNKLKYFFWKNIIPDFSCKTIDFAKKAEEKLKQIKIIQKKYLLELNQKNITVTKNALEESQKTLEFIKNYYQQ